MLRVKFGDLKAFDDLVTRHRNAVVNTLYKITGKKDGAEDLAQEVFIRVYRARKTYKARAKFTTWLFTIVRNVARNAIRDSKMHENVISLCDETESEQSQAAFKAGQPSPEDMAVLSNLREDLEKAMLSLSLNQRTAIVLSRVEGMKYSEIAEVLDVSESAVKMLISRAKKILVKKLDAYLKDI